MGGLAQLAVAAGHRVTGSDAHVYPPMSHQLEAAGIEFTEGFDPEQLTCNPDQVIVGNVMSRGRPIIEALLNSGIAYTSGPEWLYQNILQDRWVLGVSGTHGKTTTSSILAWLLEDAGLEPGFLIGGVPENFSLSARLGQSPFFVIEADEYDTAFFDKRSKFVHYHPQTLVINNMEFDHADIFPDLAAIQRQFHHLIRTIPGNGLVLYPHSDEAVANTLKEGCWSQTESFGGDEAVSDWRYRAVKDDYSVFEVYQGDTLVSTVNWQLIGPHNASNALAALLAARHAGVPVENGIQSLSGFKGIKRRMELRGEIQGIHIYDDFAHHPTAINTTLLGLRAKVPDARIIAVFEPRSNTMQMGVHQETLGDSFTAADEIYVYQPSGLGWELEEMKTRGNLSILPSVDSLVSTIAAQARSGDHIVVMSNGGFGGLHEKLLAVLGSK